MRLTYFLFAEAVALSWLILGNCTAAPKPCPTCPEPPRPAVWSRPAGYYTGCFDLCPVPCTPVLDGGN